MSDSRARRVDITCLTDQLLLNVFSSLSSDDLHKLPAICTQWRKLLDTHEADKLWRDVKVSLSEHPANTNETRGMYTWFLKHADAVRTLTIELQDSQAYVPMASILALTGRGLMGLKVYDFSEDGPLDVKDVSWLTFTPNLTSLELEEAFNKSLMQAALPQGLTHLSLSNVSEAFSNPMTRIPSGVLALPSLTSLSLATNHSDFEWGRLADLPALQQLNLSNCAFPAVPEQVRRLPHLTALRLNNCFDAASASNGLAVLSTLTGLRLLEMRDCQLKSIPVEVTGLRSLKTLLLGYNNFNEGGEYYPPILPGAYLENLELLAISDTIQDPMPMEQGIITPLQPAVALKVLRINRCWGLTLTNADIEALIENKPRFSVLEYSEDMASEVDLPALKAKFPHVKFLTRD